MVLFLLAACIVEWNGCTALDLAASERPRIVRVPVDFKVQEKETHHRNVTMIELILLEIPS